MIFFSLKPLRFFSEEVLVPRAVVVDYFNRNFSTSRVGVDGMNGRRVVGVDPFSMQLPPYTPEI